ALGRGRQPETVAPEGHGARAAGVDPCAALAPRRDRVRTAPARLPPRYPEEGAAAGEEVRPERPGTRGRAARGGSARLREAENEVARRAARQARGRRAQGDRKSTRLNSSHVSISYAVFCLKKKKIRNN